MRAKRQWSEPLDPVAIERGFRGSHERGYLPHRDAPGLSQFVTFSLADSFPISARSEWAALLRVEADSERRRLLERYLDLGRGDCTLRRPAVGSMVEDSLRHFHGSPYELCAWVVMPNHVHVVVSLGVVPMSDVVKVWKSYTAHRANRMLGRSGSFWHPDYWDTFARDPNHVSRLVRYIEENPLRAGLARDPKTWPWTSARFRDERGRLQLPPVFGHTRQSEGQ